MDQYYKTWLDLLRFVRNKYVVEVYVNDKSRSCRSFPDAVACADIRRYMKCFEDYVVSKNEDILKKFVYNQHGKHSICIIYNGKENFSTLSSVLIHEFGHCLMYSKYSQKKLTKMSKVRREIMAWTLGKKNTPKKMLPPTFDFERVKRISLKTYKK